MKMRLHEAAKTEPEEAVAWYEAVRPGLGTELLDAFDAGLSKIAGFPRAWRPLSRNTRAYRLDRFPYNIVYRVRDGAILIVAVAHHKRRPDYWRDRLRGKD